MNRKLTNPELGRKSIHDFQQSKKIPLLVILDNVRSLNNIGSVFRTADAFSIEAVYLCGITAQPPHREIQKTALGATESVHWKYFENTADLVKRLKAEKYVVLSVEQAEKSLMLNEFKVERGKKYAVVFGHEVKGVDQNVINASDAVLEIPQTGTKHSLNISVSAGIVLWDLSNKITKTISG